MTNTEIAPVTRTEVDRAYKDGYDTGAMHARGATDISQASAIEQARAVAEVAAAVRVAQQFPRDVNRALQAMRASCQQKTLAERAFYSLPRAGKSIEGSSVHLARELARCWGNTDHGVRELRRDDEAGQSEMQAWAWDQEQNVRASRSFIVPHARMVGKGAAKKRETLVDLGDIANNNNSVAARAVRETIFQIIPPWMKIEAEEICARTLQDDGTGRTLDQQIASAIAHYRDKLDVTLDQLEARLERPHDKWTPQNLGFLRVLSGEIERGEKQAADEFPTRGVTADEINPQPEQPQKHEPTPPSARRSRAQRAEPAQPESDADMFAAADAQAEQELNGDRDE